MNIFEIALAVLFWLFLGLVAYANVGYPIVIWLLSRWFGRSIDTTPRPDEELPSVSLLIAAYNEATCIEERILNALRLDYPKDKLEIVVASDGSSDGTPAIVRRYLDQGVRLLDYKERRGKSTVLNSAFAEVTGEIVLLSDANTFNEPQAVRKIVRAFRNPNVGVVCGRLVLTDPAKGGNVDSVYWKYETFLKKCESRLGALLGANGGIYAIRRELFSPIAGSTIVDDFVIPLEAKLRTGCSIVYDAEWLASHPRGPIPKPEDKSKYAKGYQAFDLHCAQCHSYQGTGGSSNPPGPDLTGYGDAEWLRLMIMAPSHPLRYGSRNQMPNFRDLEGPASGIVKLEQQRIKDSLLEQVSDDTPENVKKKKEIEEAHKLSNVSDLDREMIIRWILKEDQLLYGGEPVTVAGSPK